MSRFAPDILARAMALVRQPAAPEPQPQGTFEEQCLRLVVPVCLHFEGMYLRPYLCPAGVPTIGVGSTRYEDGTVVRLTDAPITRERAMQLLVHKLRTEYIPQTLAACPTIRTPERLAAITDFAYNCGVSALKASTMRRRILAERWEDVPDELRKWVRGGGRVLPGLVRRREADIVIFNGGVYAG